MLKIPIYEINLKDKKEMTYTCVIHQDKKAIFPLQDIDTINEIYERGESFYLKDTESDFTRQVTKANIDRFKHQRTIVMEHSYI